MNPILVLPTLWQPHIALLNAPVTWEQLSSKGHLSHRFSRKTGGSLGCEQDKAIFKLRSWCSQPMYGAFHWLRHSVLPCRSLPLGIQCLRYAAPMTLAVARNCMRWQLI